MNISKVREEAKKAKQELSANNTSLKDALAKAMQEEKVRKETLIIEKEVKVPVIEIEEGMKEVPEKVLRNLVDEE